MVQVGIIMGSDSDMPVMKGAIEILESFDIEFEVDIVSAHRTPEKLYEYAKTAHTIDTLYGSIIEAGTHMAPSIKVAEAAKVIENTQRDLNIALINELSIIFNK